MDNTKCVKQVAVPGLSWKDRQCTRKIKIERDGEGYCRQHDPVEVERRRKAKRTKGDTAAEKRQAERDRTAAEREACEGIDTEVLRSGVLRRLWESRQIVEQRLGEPGLAQVRLMTLKEAAEKLGLPVIADGTEGKRRGE